MGDNEIQWRMVLANIKDSKKVSCGLEGDITPEKKTKTEVPGGRLWQMHSGGAHISMEET